MQAGPIPIAVSARHVLQKPRLAAGAVLAALAGLTAGQVVAAIVPPTGPYCGVVHTASGVDVVLRLEVVDARVDVTAKVFGLDIYCEDTYRMDAATGVMTYDSLGKAESCIRKQFATFNQDPDNVSVTRATHPDVLRLRTVTGTTVLTAGKCSTAVETRRLQSDLLFT